MRGVQVLEGRGFSDPSLDPRLIAEFTPVTILIQDEDMEFKFNPCEYWIGRTIVDAIYNGGGYSYGNGKCVAFAKDPKRLPPPIMLKNLRLSNKSDIVAEIDNDPERLGSFDWHPSL